MEKPSGTTYGIRTRDSSVKGRRLNPLTNAADFNLRTAKITLGALAAKFILSSLSCSYSEEICFNINFFRAAVLRYFSL